MNICGVTDLRTTKFAETILELLELPVLDHAQACALFAAASAG